jgi:RNA polymerase sigma-70 factor, ECF subfamily
VAAVNLRTRSRGTGEVHALPDEQLLSAYTSGHHPEAAFAEFVDRYERRVYAVCHRYFGNTTDAEDATQDTFLRIARHAASFTGDSKLSTWVYRVTVNTCHDLARRRARRPENPSPDVTEMVDATRQHDAIGWDAGDPAIAGETSSAVQAALLQLDDVSRSLLLLVAIEGVPYAEAARAHDMPVGTAKSRVHRARARLAELLGPLADGNPGDLGDVGQHGDPRPDPKGLT